MRNATGRRGSFVAQSECAGRRHSKYLVSKHKILLALRVRSSHRVLQSNGIRGPGMRRSCLASCCAPGSWVLSAIVARTPHVCVQVWVDRSGVRGLRRIRGSDLTLAARPGWPHSVAPEISIAVVERYVIVASRKGVACSMTASLRASATFALRGAVLSAIARTNASAKNGRWLRRSGAERALALVDGGRPSVLNAAARTCRMVSCGRQNRSIA